MKTKVLQFYRILIKESYKAICLLLLFFICFHFDSNAQVQRLDSIPIVNLGPDGNVCDNEPRLLNAYNLGCSYEWKFNGSIISDSSYIYASKAGTYSVKVISPDSLEAFDTIKLKLVLSPVFRITANKTFEKFTVDFSVDPFIPGCTYLWDFKDPTSSSNSSQFSSPSHTFIFLPDYITVTVKNFVNGCSKTDTFWHISDVLFWGIKYTPASFFNVKVSPNPITSSSKLSFTVKNPSSTVSLKACDLLGKERYVLFENKLFFQGENHIDLTSYINISGSGISLLKLSIDDVPMSIKVIK